MEMESSKVSVYHTLSAVRPNNLKNRLRWDLQFPYDGVRKDLKALIHHATRLSDPVQLVDSGTKISDSIEFCHGYETSFGKVEEDSFVRFQSAPSKT